MPDATSTAAGQAGASAPGAGQSQGQPPFGSSPATQPTQNRGYEAAGLSKIAVAVQMLEQLLPLVGASSDPGRDVLKAIQMLAKHIPPGTVSPAAKQNDMQSMMMKQAQQGPMIAQMRQQAAAGAGGAGAAPAAAAA